MKPQATFKFIYISIWLLVVELTNAQVIHPNNDNSHINPNPEKSNTTDSKPNNISDSTIKNTQTSNRTAVLLFAPNMECKISLDGTDIGTIQANNIQKMEVPLGEHLVVAKTLDSKDAVTKTVNANMPIQKVVELDLLSLKNAREEKVKKENEVFAKNNNLTVTQNMEITTKNLITEMEKNISYQSDCKRIQQLILSGADVNATTKTGRSALHYSSNANAVELTKLLIDKGAFVDPKDEGGKTPLTWACQSKSEEVAELLIAAGADINLQDNSGGTPLYYCSQGNAISIAKLLIENRANVNLGAYEHWKYVPLHIASNANFYEMAELLIQNGANVNVKDNYGETPLHMAALGNGGPTRSIEVAKVLIENGADVNAKNNRGETPMDLADFAKNRNMKAFLREHGGK